MLKPSINYLKIIFIFCVAMIVCFAFANWRIFWARQKVDNKLKQANQVLQESILENENIQGKILQSKTYDYLEQVAREDLNFKKSGEQVVAFPADQTLQETDTSQKIRVLWQKFVEMKKKE